MYKPNPQSAFRVKFDFRVDFTNGGHVQGEDFLLDIEGNDISDDLLKSMIVDAMNLAKAGKVIREWGQVLKYKVLIPEIVFGSVPSLYVAALLFRPRPIESLRLRGE